MTALRVQARRSVAYTLYDRPIVAPQIAFTRHQGRCTCQLSNRPFFVLALDKRISHEELIRAIRFTIAAEYEATQQYMQLAESIDHPLAIKVLTEIANEERVYAGELLRLLHELSLDEARFYAKGTKEVEGKIKNDPANSCTSAWRGRLIRPD